MRGKKRNQFPNPQEHMAWCVFDKSGPPFSAVLKFGHMLGCNLKFLPLRTIARAPWKLNSSKPINWVRVQCHTKETSTLKTGGNNYEITDVQCTDYPVSGAQPQIGLTFTFDQPAIKLNDSTTRLDLIILNPVLSDVTSIVLVGDYENAVGKI